MTDVQSNVGAQSSEALRQWLVRRQRHRSRATTSGIVGSILALLLAWLALETLLSLLGQPALLASPQAAGQWLADVPLALSRPSSVLAGTLLALLGLLVLWIALAPGAKTNRALESDRAAVVVDDAVVANAVAKVAQSSARVPADHVSVRLGGGTGTVDVRPDGALPVDREAVRQAVAQELQRWRLPRELRFAINVLQREVGQA